MDNKRPASKEPRYETSAPPTERVTRPEWVPHWSVRGVARETRRAATKAAQRAGMNLGDWVEKVLREAAAKTEGRSTRPPWIAPWDIRGVSPVTRQAATKAAQREGMSQGRWIDKILREATAEASDAPLSGAPDKLDEGVDPRSRAGALVHRFMEEEQ